MTLLILYILCIQRPDTRLDYVHGLPPLCSHNVHNTAGSIPQPCSFFPSTVLLHSLTSTSSTDPRAEHGKCSFHPTHSENCAHSTTIYTILVSILQILEMKNGARSPLSYPVQPVPVDYIAKKLQTSMSVMSRDLEIWLKNGRVAIFGYLSGISVLQSMIYWGKSCAGTNFIFYSEMEGAHGTGFAGLVAIVSGVT